MPDYDDMDPRGWAEADHKAASGGEKFKKLLAENYHAIINFAQYYAQGYYDGRVECLDDMIEKDAWTDVERHAFKTGYDAGVADYCALDIPPDERPEDTDWEEEVT